jgi:ring-opening amidohydrolase-like protein
MSSESLTTAVDAVLAPLEHAADVSGLERLLKDGRLQPDEVVAVTGKTEGCTPDETSRVEADRAVRHFLAEHGSRSQADIARIPMVFTAGGVGILAPQVVLYSRYQAEPAADDAGRLTVGTARSVVMQPEWTGTSRVVEANAAAVRAAAADAGIDAADAEYVIGKAYHVSQEELAAARASGHRIPEVDDHTLFRKTSGGGGLGVAVAVDGLPVPHGGQIGTQMELWSGKASISANLWESVTGEGPHTQLVLLGNRPGAGGRLRVGHAVVTDLLDVEALPRALGRAGLGIGPGPLTAEQRARVVALYIKIGPPPDGRLRGRRQVVDNPNYGNEVKAAVAGMFAGFLQDSALWISGSATQQGPPGGGTLAVVVDVS